VTTKDKTLDYYMKLPYTFEAKHDEDGWFAKVVELPGCMTWADTFEELEPMIEDAMRGWIEDALEHGDPIPEPRDTEDYSGKVNLRMPKSLHRDLSREAEAEGVSLNQIMVTTLARAVGRQRQVAGDTISVDPQEARSQQRVNEAAEKFTDALVQSYKAVADRSSSVSAQERSTQLTEVFFNETINNLRAQAEQNRQTSEQLGEQQRQADAAQTLTRESVEAYNEFLNSVFSFWQRGVQTAERGVRETEPATKGEKS